MNERRASNLKFAAVLALIPMVVLFLTFMQGSGSTPVWRSAAGFLVGWIAATLAMAVVPEAAPERFPPDATYRMHIACPECGHANDLFRRGCPGGKCTTVNRRWSYHPVDAVLILGFVVFFLAYGEATG